MKEREKVCMVITGDPTGGASMNVWSIIPIYTIMEDMDGDIIPVTDGAHHHHHRHRNIMDMAMDIRRHHHHHHLHLTMDTHRPIIRITMEDIPKCMTILNTRK